MSEAEPNARNEVVITPDSFTVEIMECSKYACFHVVMRFEQSGKKDVVVTLPAASETCQALQMALGIAEHKIANMKTGARN